MLLVCYRKIAEQRGTRAATSSLLPQADLSGEFFLHFFSSLFLLFFSCFFFFISMASQAANMLFLNVSDKSSLPLFLSLPHSRVPIHSSFFPFPFHTIRMHFSFPHPTSLYLYLAFLLNYRPSKYLRGECSRARSLFLLLFLNHPPCSSALFFFRLFFFIRFLVVRTLLNIHRDTQAAVSGSGRLRTSFENGLRFQWIARSW